MSEKPEYCYDKKGIPILPGDLVKMFHFRSSLRREKHYMYKHVMSLKKYDHGWMYLLSHLEVDYDSSWNLKADGCIMNGMEIIQGYGTDGMLYRDRERKVDQ